MRRLCCLLLALVTLCGCSVAGSVTEQSMSGVSYEVFVRSFCDTDGDGIGDLPGVTSRLPYIAFLGVSRLWLMPIHPSPSYHKYDVTDYKAIDPQYGTLADFDALIAACGEEGIGVTLDLVVNHTASTHPWFVEACQALRDGVDSPYIDWYHFTQGEGQHAVQSTDWFYEGQFGDHMPDLNLDNPAVRAEIADIIAFWQARGVTGFRLDAVTSYYTGATDSNADFLRFITDTAKAGDPDCYVVGEAWTDAETILRLYGSGIDSLFNFPAADQDGRFLKSADKGRGALAASSLADWNTRIREVSPASVDALFLTNHDMGRSAGVLRRDAVKERAAAMMYLLMPGAPTIYYGEELGMTGSGRDENKRLPMLWSVADTSLLCAPPPDADQQQRLQAGVDAQEDDPDSLLNWYRAVIALRRQCPELLRGTMAAMDTGNDAVCAYTMTEDGCTLMVLMNVSPQDAASIDVADGMTVVGQLNDAALSGNLAMLPPISCLVLQ